MTSRIPGNMLGLPADTDLQALIDATSAAGGGVLSLGGATFTRTTGLVVKDNVTLDLGGGRLLFNLSGANDFGVRLRNRAHVCNGRIDVVSTGSPGSQAGIHAPLLIGALYGESPSTASISADEGVSGWSARNLRLSTDRDGKVAVQVIGGANNGVIENIDVPDSALIGGGVHLDWGTVGAINSADIAASRTAFNAGTAYTTHPHNITIRNIRLGALTKAKGGIDVGSFGVRLSGVYNVIVENVRAKSVTYAMVKITAGDCGFEFAPVAVKPLRMKGIVVDGVAVESTGDGNLVSVDSYADNVAAAGGYTPLIDPLHETDMEVRRVTGTGSGGASAVAGLDVRQIRGGRFTYISASGYSYGCLVDERVFGAQIHGSFFGNRGHGIFIDHGSFPPEDVTVLPGTHCYQNGQDGGFSTPAGVCLQNCLRVRLDGVLLGHRTAASETTQQQGIRLSTVTKPTAPTIENCHVFSVKTGGTAYSLMSSTDYGFIRLFRNNGAAAAITTKLTGCDILPVNRVWGADGVERGHFVAQRTVLSADTTPGAGTWVVGDRIEHLTFAAGKNGTVCTVAGSPGTWVLY